MNEMPRVLTNTERAELRQRVRKAVALLALLQDYRAEVQQPHHCGCLLFAPVAQGYRCLYCMPPLDLPDQLRRMIEESMQ